ncbi:MAG: polysaccharide deacetylase family protein [Anaerolineae bacterium]
MTPKLSPHSKSTFAQIFFLLLAFIIVTGLATTSVAGKTNHAITTLEYTIDRTAVPELNYTDLTLIINVSDATAIDVKNGENVSIPYKSGPAADEITLTTTSNRVIVTIDGMTNLTSVGGFRKANLKDNYAWAYSHGFDDNFALDNERQIFLDRNIPATFNVVSEWVEENQFWEGDFSPAEFAEIVDAGWDINNHTSDHETGDGQSNGCSDTLTRAERKADVLAAQAQLESHLANTSRPDYKIIGFAIPCGGSAQWADYPGIIHEIRDNNEADLLYYEGGQGSPVYMTVNPPFDLNRDILRDGRIDGSGAQSIFITNTFDSISSQTQQSGTPIWYTTLSHGEIIFGNNETALAETIDYLINNYGSNGTNEVWIAGTATVYSYLLVRDKSVVTQLQGPELTVTPTSMATSEPTATTTPTLPPTITPTETLAATQEPSENDVFIYLPFTMTGN